MRLANLVLAGLSTLIGVSKVDITEPVKPIVKDEDVLIVDFYNESYYGAFSNSENSTISFKFSLCNAKSYFYVKYYNNRTNALLINESYRIWDYMDTGQRINYTLKTKNRLSSDGLKVVFSTGEEGNDLKVKTVVIYPTSSNIIYSYQYINAPYYTENQIFKIESNVIKNKESVRFENTVDYLTNNTFNAIDISEISFTYDEGFDLINKSSNKYLKILDLDNIFPYLNKDINNYIYVPLECVQNGVDISLKYKSHFYYDPKTLDISFTSKNGYIETDRFYIPKNKLKLLENATFAVEMSDFGRSKMNINIPLTFIKDKNFIGMCNDSNHCIIGGIRE